MNTTHFSNAVNPLSERPNAEGEWKKDCTSDDLKAKLEVLFKLCRSNDWERVLTRLTEEPNLGVQLIVMDNYINTTIMHQAITSKGDIEVRAKVIATILQQFPRAAALRNGYGSLPLHVISQRNTKMDSKTKDRLIQQLVQAYPGAIVEPGGMGKRTPLHVIFTDYVSPNLTKILIENGNEACFMKDKKGFLPAHVACSRHCSPEKLRMLLQVNPQAIFEETNQGHSLLDLAKLTATKSHPNYALIAELERLLTTHAEIAELSNPGGVAATFQEQTYWPQMRNPWDHTTHHERNGMMSCMANSASAKMNSSYRHDFETREAPMAHNGMAPYHDPYPEYAPDFFRNTAFADTVESSPMDGFVVKDHPLESVPSEACCNHASKRKAEDDGADNDEFPPVDGHHHKRSKSNCSDVSFSSYNQAAGLLLNFSRGPTQSNSSVGEECGTVLTAI